MKALLAAFAAYAATVTAGPLLVDDPMPLHWGVAGVADRMGSPERWAVENAVLGAVLVGLYGLASLLAARAPLRWLNIPDRAYWVRPENVARVRAMVAADVRVLLTELVWGMAALQATVIADVRRGEEALGGAPVLVFVGIILLLLVGTALSQRTKYLVPPAEWTGQGS